MGFDEGEEEEVPGENEEPQDEGSEAGEGSNTGDEEQYHEAYYERTSTPQVICIGPNTFFFITDQSNSGSDSDYSATERKRISREKKARDQKYGPSKSQGMKTKVPTARPEESVGASKMPTSRDEGGTLNDDITEQLKGWPLKPGPLPAEAAEGIEALQTMVIERAEALGREFGKSRREILIAAGLGLKGGRKENPANVYRKWYYATHQKPENSEDPLFSHGVTN
jgi:hypothetical protein